MTDDRDRQRSKVYAWEERFVAPRDPSAIAFAQAQGVVDAVWVEMGLRFPPKVERLPRRARSTLADATRLSIRLADSSPSWWLLHELSHAMSITHDGQSDGHGGHKTSPLIGSGSLQEFESGGIVVRRFECPGRGR